MNETTPEQRARNLTAGAPAAGRRVDPVVLPDREYVTIKEAMTLLGVGRRTIMNWFESDPPKIQKFRARNGYGVRIDRDELLSWNKFRVREPIVIEKDETAG